MAAADALVRELTKRGVARASELASALGISQPTFSRLVAAAGAQVVRLGRGPATRYAAARAVEGLGSDVPVHRIDAHGKVEHVAQLRLLSGGRHWLSLGPARGELLEGPPPFVVDMSPQGYLGRSFPARHPELRLSARVSDWSDDHRLVALARRGEDCVGDLVLGAESLDRWYAWTPHEVTREDYPALARASAQGDPGSSAGGEHPKFLALSGGRHVLVKFAAGDGAAAQRWRDLLVCEAHALERVRAAGLDAAQAAWCDVDGLRFLEVTRFDRAGVRGRRELRSFSVLDAEHVGSGGTWTDVAHGLRSQQHLSEEDARRARWLDVFGQLIANTDRHLGNLSCFAELGSPALRLAPVYDMLPMAFAPSGSMLVERELAPARPSARTRDVWEDAAAHAHGYWASLSQEPALSEDMRRIAERCRVLLAERIDALGGR